MQGFALTSYHVDMSEDIKLNDLLPSLTRRSAGRKSVS